MSTSCACVTKHTLERVPPMSSTMRPFLSDCEFGCIIVMIVANFNYMDCSLEQDVSLDYVKPTKIMSEGHSNTIIILIICLPAPLIGSGHAQVWLRMSCRTH